MIKLENWEVVGWGPAIRGMRNPMNSWEKSDSHYCTDRLTCEGCLGRSGIDGCLLSGINPLIIGPNDLALMMKLRNAGTDHRKFMRMLVVYVDITAPLYWWKEFDTYKVGTVANSCSTMHKIHAKEFTMEDFSIERLEPLAYGVMQSVVEILEYYRKAYNAARHRDPESPYNKDDVTACFHNMIQLLPTSYNQKRTVMLNYEVLANIYKSRKNHKLDEWRELSKWIEGLPYSEIITGHKDGTPVESPVSYKYSVSIKGQAIPGFVTAGENATDDEIRRAILDTICDGVTYERN